MIFQSADVSVSSQFAKLFLECIEVGLYKSGESPVLKKARGGLMIVLLQNSRSSPIPVYIVEGEKLKCFQVDGIGPGRYNYSRKIVRRKATGDLGWAGSVAKFLAGRNMVVGENTTPWPAEPDLAFIRQDLESQCPGLVFTWTKNSKLVQLGRISADGKFTPKVVTK